VGVDEDRLPAAYAVVDKLEREPRERSLERLQSEVDLSEAEATDLLDLFREPGLDAVRERYGDDARVLDELVRLEEYLDLLGAMGLGDYVSFDLTIVRGLAYYTGIVFEIFDRDGELRAICGGGRYDRLLELVGGDAMPAVGFGMGDVVLAELLGDKGLLPVYARSLDYYLVIIGDAQRVPAMALAHTLRDRGRAVAYGLRGQGVRKQFRAAETEGAREVLVLGPDEVAAGEVVVRDMASGEERRASLESFPEAVDR
jgi:histidyl-tRNA synthetase